MCGVCEPLLALVIISLVTAAPPPTQFFQILTGKRCDKFWDLVFYFVGLLILYLLSVHRYIPLSSVQKQFITGGIGAESVTGILFENYRYLGF